MTETVPLRVFTSYNFPVFALTAIARLAFSSAVDGSTVAVCARATTPTTTNNIATKYL